MIYVNGNLLYVAKCKKLIAISAASLHRFSRKPIFSEMLTAGACRKEQKKREYPFIFKFHCVLLAAF